MKMPGFLTKTLSKLNPLPLLGKAVAKPVETLAMNAIQNALLKSLSSLVKGLTAGALVSLAALADKLPGIANPGDKIEVYAVAAVVAVLHALISGIKRLTTFDVSKAS